MANTTEILLKFKLAQLEGRLALYESLVSEISKLEIIEKVASDVKLKLEDIVTVWSKCYPEKNDG
jgi:hypothetical protein